MATNSNSLWHGTGQSSVEALARLEVALHTGQFFTGSKIEVLAPGKESSFNTRTLCQTTGKSLQFKVN